MFFIDFSSVLRLKDALTIPEILSAIQHLEMPVSDALTLFEHVDIMGTGRITLDDLMDARHSKDRLIRRKEKSVQYHLICI